MKKRSLFFAILLIMYYSCKKESNENNQSDKILCNNKKEINFLNEDFKIVLDSFIVNISKYPVHKYETILISLYKDANDTILRLENSPPFEKENLKIVLKYNNFDLLFFAPDYLNDKLSSFVKIENMENIEKVEIDTLNEIDMIYSSSYIINCGKIKFSKTPLEWSTDSNNSN